MTPAVVAAVEADEERDKLRKGWAAWAGVSLMVNVIWLGTWITEGDPSVLLADLGHGPVGRGHGDRHAQRPSPLRPDRDQSP